MSERWNKNWCPNNAYIPINVAFKIKKNGKTWKIYKNFAAFYKKRNLKDFNPSELFSKFYDFLSLKASLYKDIEII